MELVPAVNTMVWQKFHVFSSKNRLVKKENLRGHVFWATLYIVLVAIFVKISTLDKRWTKKWWGHLIADLKMGILSKNPRIRSTVLNWVNFPDFTEWILGKILHKLRINSNTINYSSKSSFRSWWSAAVAWPVLPGLCIASYKFFLLKTLN